MKTKIFTLLLAVAASVGTMFAEGIKIGDLYYNLNYGTAEVTYQLRFNENNYAGLTDVVIPSSITYNNVSYSVTSIGEYAFRDCKSLTTIDIPNSITYIGSQAFYGCKSLLAIDLPPYITVITQTLFSGCSSLKSLVIPEGVTTIEAEAFKFCSSLVSVTFPSSITSIYGSYLFHGSGNIKAIFVPCGEVERFKEMLHGTDSKNDKIKELPLPYVLTLTASNGNIKTNFDSLSICNENRQLICSPIPNRGYQFVRWSDGNTENPRTIELTQDTTMEAIFDYLLEGKCGKDSALTWTFEPASMALNISGKGALSENYTYGTFIESLTIGNEITSIGEWAFGECNNLKNVIIGSSVKVLEESAFYRCSAIETITCYGQRPPTVNQNALYGLDYSTIIYVPADYLETYKMHDAWGLYDVRPLGAKSTETTDVNVTPAENTAEVAWPAVSGAATYELVIKDKSGNVICTLIFNANGQLTSIAFAPSRNGAPQQAQAAGFSFTVTGLEEGTSYDLTITSKDNNGGTLDTKTVSFTTTGVSTRIGNVLSNQVPCTKVIRDSQIFILRGNKTYTLQGQEIIVP